MALEFEWNAAKARFNEQKHEVSFEEAATVFSDPLALTILDPRFEHAEPRFVTIGTSRAGRLLVVAHCDRQDQIRIISARKPTKRERYAYEEGD
jgi:uncharacterized DUF497 family protein